MKMNLLNLINLLINALERAARWISEKIAVVIQEQKLTQTRKTILLNELVESASPGVDYFVLIILSCTIATFGLINNSSGTIIGAMLIAPLMSPILGLSIASVIGLNQLFRRSLIAVLEGSALIISLSALLTFFTYKLPLGSLAALSSEALARTSPSPLDLGIALAGGAAATYALAHPRLSAALPGVAIATALAPPLCTVGIGIAFLQPSVILGALLLFITNLSAISFAGIITFTAFGFSRKLGPEDNHLEQSVSRSALLVIIISIFLGVLAWNTFTELSLTNQASYAIMESVSPFADVHLVDLNIISEGETKRISATLRANRELSHQEVVAIQEEIALRLQKPVSLELVVVPMQILDPLKPPTPTIQPSPTLQPTSTPGAAFARSARSGWLQVMDADGEVVRFELPVNSPVWIHFDRQIEINSETWVEIMDVFGRIGWVRMGDLVLPENTPIP
jgi:uncharacterized hydrophobic protein (TIGR00271 family)